MSKKKIFCKPIYVKNKYAWCDWQFPIMKGYKMACCDCGLIHGVEFKIVKVEKEYKNGTFRYSPVKGMRVAMRLKRHK